MRDEIKAKAMSLLRRAGISHVSNSALCCMGVAVAVLLGFALWRFWPVGSSDSFQVADASGTVSTVGETDGGDAASAQESDAQDGATAQGEGTGASSTAGQQSGSLLAVDVEGAVVAPGLYRLTAGSRVGDAIEAASGFAEGAAQAKVNRAQKLEDGMQVYVPSLEEQAASGSQQSAAGASSGAGSTASQVQEKVNINTATSEQLQTLQGIGEGMAARIIDYREANGSFKSIEDIKNVSGIGDARFAAIEKNITV